MKRCVTHAALSILVLSAAAVVATFLPQLCDRGHGGTGFMPDAKASYFDLKNPPGS